MLIDIIAGARPNFMKIASIIKEIDNAMKSGVDISFRLIHTGQHYDRNMSGSFFEELGIPSPDINLEAGSGSQAEQTAAIMIRYEKVLAGNKPDLCMVVGDVNSTMACSITAKKMGVDVAHVEGGIRSGDLMMPEEINRIVTDSISDYFYTTSVTANENLKRAGIPVERIIFVGNTMIDTLLANLSNLQKPDVANLNELKGGQYLVMTLHRPANVDAEENLKKLISHILSASDPEKIIFPVHPRTRKILDRIGIEDEKLIYTEPMGYLQFIWLVKHARAVITDSGGITEEATVLGVPCLTLRDTTERPETITIGTNELIGTDPKAIKPALEKIFKERWKKGNIPEKWDGKAAERIVAHLLSLKV